MAKLARNMLIKFGEKVKIWSFLTIRSKVGNEYFLRFGKIFIAAHFSHYLAADSVFESIAEAKHKFSRFLEDYFPPTHPSYTSIYTYMKGFYMKLRPRAVQN